MRPRLEQEGRLARAPLPKVIDGAILVSSASWRVRQPGCFSRGRFATWLSTFTCNALSFMVKWKHKTYFIFIQQKVGEHFLGARHPGQGAQVPQHLSLGACTLLELVLGSPVQ